MGYPDFHRTVFAASKNSEQKTGSVTSTDTSVAFSQQIKSFIIINDGPNPCHINFDATATTSNMKIPAKSWFYVDFPVTVLHFICASGETATVYCVGLY